MADFTVSTDVDALMRSADNAAIKTQLGIFTPEAIMNPVVEGMGLLNAFKGSSAAYSLRDLTGDDPNVVDVRRASDDTTATFKASEMGSVVENWVNATVALPLDTASGASAAYSLRDLAAIRSDITSSGDTGGETTGALVVQVRRSSDQEIKSFTAADVAGGALLSWVGTGATDHGHVVTWYDQSGNANHATQATPASQPKIVDGGTLVDGGIQFEGTNANFNALDCAPLYSNGDDVSVICATKRVTTGDWATILGNTVSTANSIILLDHASLRQPRVVAGGIIVNSTAVSNSVMHIRSAFWDNSAGTIRSYVSGGDEQVATGGVSIVAPVGNRIGDHDLATVSGTTIISEIIVYNSDQSLKRTAIESNMADYYGDINLPAGFDSGNDTVDGFVAKWYDQSGINHAVQETATSQPKIVENGVYLGEVKFDGVDDQLDYPLAISTLNNASSFVLASFQNTSDNQFVLAMSGGGNNRWFAPIIWNGSYRFGYGSTIDNINLGTPDTNKHLFTATAGATTAEGFIDGVSKGAQPSTSDAVGDQSFIGAHTSSQSYPLDGSISEIIIYDSDQSAARTHIEYNINNAYSIY